MTNQKRQDSWQKVITQWQQSGLSGAAFCRQRSVSYRQFFYWRQKLTDDQTGESEQSTGFTRVTQGKESIATSELGLTLPGGVSITGLNANNIHLGTSKNPAISQLRERSICPKHLLSTQFHVDF